MIRINSTLLSALFTTPNPQPQRAEVGKLYNELTNRIFPNKDYFIDFLQAQTIDKQYEYATRIIHSLCYHANFPPAYYALNDVLCIENYNSNYIDKDASYIPRDHYLHIVNLYILGIYVFFYNAELYSRIMIENRFKRKKYYAENTKKDCIKDFLSEWKYFCLFHDVGYTAELLGNKKNEGKRETIIKEITAASGHFQASFSDCNTLKQSAFWGTIEIISKILTSLFVLKNSTEFISSKHDIFRDVRTTPLMLYSQSKNTFEVISFQQIATFFDNCRKLVKMYSNHCLKTLLPIVDERAISVVGFDKESGQAVFLSYYDQTKREIAILSGNEKTPELVKLANNPDLIIYDDYSSSYELEILIKGSTEINALKGFLEEDNIVRTYVTANRFLGRLFLNISSEQQFLDFQYNVYFWLYEQLESKVLGNALDEHLNSHDIASDEYSSDAVKANAKRTQMIIDSLAINNTDIDAVCFDYLRNAKYPKYAKKKSKPKNASEMLAVTVEQFYNRMKSVINDPSVLTALRNKAETVCLERLEDDIVLIQLYSQIYLKLKSALSKTKKSFSYDYVSCTTQGTSFLGKCIGKEIQCFFFGETIGSVRRKYRLQHGITTDHGVFSAYYAAGVFEMYRNALLKARTDQEKKLLSILFSITGDYAVSKEKYIENYNHIFKNTLFAIFTHNLYPSYFNSSKLAKYKTKLNDQPFSYFALLCDALQQWNRPHTLLPSALAVRPNDDASEEYNIIIKENQICIKERNTLRAHMRLENLVNNMGTYLEDIDAFIKIET